MATQGRVGVSVPTSAETPLNVASRLLRQLEFKADAAPARDAVQVSGVTDTTAPKGSPLTNGITLAAGASLNVSHGLGRAPLGFVAITMGGPVGVLQNDTATLSADVQKQLGRVKNTGGASVTFALEWR